MSPRPILKRPSNPGIPHEHQPHHAVHFPPSPALTRTFVAHSSTTYDRSPIVVAPNSCALPERGCPGRTYTLDDPSPSRSSPSTPGRRLQHPYTGRDVHPRALVQPAVNPHILPQHDDGALRTPSTRATSFVPPPLIPDLSSESDESDGFISPPPDYNAYPSIPRSSRSNTKHYPFSPYDMYGPTTTSVPPMTYHPHTSPIPPNHSLREEDTQLQKARRRRDRERQRERSRERDRIRGVLVDEDEYGAEDIVVSSSKHGSRGTSLCSAFSRFGIDDPDSGCLGGF